LLALSVSFKDDCFNSTPVIIKLAINPKHSAGTVKKETVRVKKSGFS